MSNRPLVIFVNELPINTSAATYIDFKGRTLLPTWTAIDIQKELRTTYENQIGNVTTWFRTYGQNAASRVKWWWFMAASRTVSWTPALFVDLICAMTLVKCLEARETQTVYLVDFPKRIQLFLSEIKPQWIFENLKKPKQRNFLLIAKAFALFVVACKDFFKFSDAPLVNGARTVVFSHLLNAKNLTTSGDHFFGNLFFDASLTKNDFYWLYLDDERKSEHALRHVAIDTQRQYSLTTDHLHITDLPKFILMCLSCFLQIFKLRFHKQPFSFNEASVYAVAPAFFIERILYRPPFTEFKVYLGARRLFKNKSIKNIVYPFEEKGLERALLKAANEANLKTVGFAHPIYSEGHIYLKHDNATRPEPQVVACTSHAQQLWLRDRWCIPKENLVVWGSPRNQQNPPFETAFIASKEPLRILVLIGLGHETKILGQYLKKIPTLFEGCEVLIRPYPYAWQIEQRYWEQKIKEQNPNTKIGNEPLREQLNWCHVSLFCSTSAGIESMLAGRPAIYVDLNEAVDLNPLSGKLNHVLQAFAPRELKALLQTLRHMPHSEYETLALSVRAAATSLFEPICYESIQSTLRES